MQYRKIGLALALSASFGLMACGDSDSSSSNGAAGGDELFSGSCKVQEDPFKTITTSDDFTSEVSVTYDDGKIITKSSVKYASQSFADEGCAEAKKEAEEADEDVVAKVKCDGKTVTLTKTEDGDEDDYEEAMAEESFVCEFINSMAANSSDSKSGKSSSSKGEKSSSSKKDDGNKDDGSASKIDGKVTYEDDEMTYYGNGCDFKKSDKKWEFTYTYTDITKLVTDANIKCTRIETEEDGYTSYEVKCVKTEITTGKSVNIYCYEADVETSRGTHVSTCKDGEWKEVHTTTDDVDYLFHQYMAECQEVNGHPEWRDEHSTYGDDDDDDSDTGDDEDNDDDDIESSSSEEDLSSSSEDDDWDDDDDDVDFDFVFSGCENFDVDDDVWELSITLGDFSEDIKVEWLSKDEYKMTSFINGEEDESKTAYLEEGESRQDMYDEVCGDAD